MSDLRWARAAIFVAIAARTMEISRIAMSQCDLHGGRLEAMRGRDWWRAKDPTAIFEETRMADRIQDSNRRRMIRLTVFGLAAPSLGVALTSGVALAADPPEVSETDPQAAALKYKKDATKAPERKDASATCGNCALYTGKAGAATGPCTLFQGKLVSAKGWCSAWAKKA
jgi:hypothetical protein